MKKGAQLFGGLFICAIIWGSIAFYNFKFGTEAQYNAGIDMLKNNKWHEASNIFIKLEGKNEVYYKNSKELYNYAVAREYFDKGDYNQALLYITKNPVGYNGPLSKEMADFTSQLLKIIKPKEPLRLQIEESWLTQNSIGIPEAHVKVKNVSSKTIDAFTVEIDCYNGFDEPVYGYGSKPSFIGLAQDLTLKPNQYFGDNRFWTLHGFDNAIKIKVKVKRVHFTDGTTWENE